MLLVYSSAFYARDLETKSTNKWSLMVSVCFANRLLRKTTPLIFFNKETVVNTVGKIWRVAFIFHHRV